MDVRYVMTLLVLFVGCICATLLDDQQDNGVQPYDQVYRVSIVFNIVLSVSDSAGVVIFLMHV